MAKFNIEVDSDSKAVTITKDGKAITPDSFCVSVYEYTDMDGTDKNDVCVSYTTEEGENVMSSYMLRFTVGDMDDASEGKDNYGIAKQIKSVHSRISATYKLDKALSKKK